MKGFRQYLRENGIDLDTMFPQGTSPLGALGKGDQDAEGVMRVLRLAVEDHYDEVMSFLHNLGGKNPQIMDELDDMSRANLNKPLSRRKPGGKATGFGMTDRDEVVPSGADRADGGGGTEPN